MICGKASFTTPPDVVTVPVAFLVTSWAMVDVWWWWRRLISWALHRYNPPTKPMVAANLKNSFWKGWKKSKPEFLGFEMLDFQGRMRNPINAETFFDQLLGDDELIWSGKIRSLKLCLGYSHFWYSGLLGLFGLHGWWQTTQFYGDCPETNISPLKLGRAVGFREGAHILQNSEFVNVSFWIFPMAQPGP